jgi:hypothetical protein
MVCAGVGEGMGNSVHLRSGMKWLVSVMGQRSTGVCCKICAKHVVYVIHILFLRILPFWRWVVMNANMYYRMHNEWDQRGCRCWTLQLYY